MTKNITIYTSDTCGQCHMVKKYLGMKGHNFDEVNIDQQPEKRQEMFNMTGQARVPVTIVTKTDGSQDVTIGYNLTKLSSAIS